MYTMDYENWSRLSMADKIRRFDKPVDKPVDKPLPIYVWSLLEAMDIGSSILKMNGLKRTMSKNEKRSLKKKLRLGKARFLED